MRAIAATVIACLLTLRGIQIAVAQEVENITLEAVVVDSNASVDSKFELKDHRGKTIVLHFLLKTECPFCLKYTHQYAKLAATTPDVIHLFIKPDSEDEIHSWISQLAKTGAAKFPAIYQDPGAKLAKRFGIPDGYRFHGQTVHYPALVVLNGDGKEIFRYVGKSNSDRMPIEKFVEKLESMTAK
ncbi:MAG: redoxin domain-containing protein [Pirellula sp.]